MTSTRCRPINPQYGAPVEFGGDLCPHSRPPRSAGSHAVLQHLLTVSRAGSSRAAPIAAQGRGSCDYTDAMIDRKSPRPWPGAGVRFDGSDLMPGAVGSGTFWKA